MAIGTLSQLDLAAESKAQAGKNAALVLSMTGDQMALENMMSKAKADVSVNKGIADIYAKTGEIIEDTGKDIKSK
jgi:hypothetical protein